MRTGLRLALAVLGLAGLTLVASALATSGSIARTGFDPLRLLLPPVRTVPAGRRVLLLSDEPEAVGGPGILDAGTVDGPFRVFLYAVADAPRPLRFAVLAADPGTVPVRVTLTRLAAAGPSGDFQAVAQAAGQAFLAARAYRRVVVRPGAPADLVPALTAQAAAGGELVNAIVDGSTDGPAVILTAATYTLPLRPTDLPVLPPGRPPGSILRGTFPHADYDVIVPAFARDRTLVLQAAGGYVRGYSPLDRRPVRDDGNYGVLYRVEVDRYADGAGALARLAAADDLRLAAQVTAAVGAAATLGLAASVPWAAWLAALPHRWLQAAVAAPARVLAAERLYVVRFHWMAPAAVNLPSTIDLPYLPPG